MIKKPRQPITDPNEMWRIYLTEGYENARLSKQLFRMLPTNPRCKSCYAPFKGVGGTLVKIFFNKAPSPHNPLMCNACEHFARKYPGGAETDLAMVFADIRGSTGLAEKMTSFAFGQLINRFYNVSSDILSRHYAFIDRLVGDEMIGYFFPGTSGPDYTTAAVQASIELLQATGNVQGSEPWAPIGIGVHKGIAYFGVVGKKDGVMDLTALGDSVNTTARLASQAGPGEILVSEDAYQAAGLALGELEERCLELKGKSEPIAVRVLRA